MIIKRTNIPYSGRSLYGADTKSTVKRMVVSSRSVAGGFDTVTPTGTASCQLSAAVTNVYTTDLPVTVELEVVATVGNERVPTCVDTDNITGLRNHMSVTVTDNGTDHAVINVTLQAALTVSGSLNIPVLVNASVGADLIQIGTGQTMKDAFEARTSTTRTLECVWEWNILTLNANGTITRGPVQWKSTMARRFSNGQGPLEQDTLYMDLIMRMGDRNVYKCVTSYTQTAGQTWSEVSSNWQVDNDYAIVAASLILGQNERITLNADNEIIAYNSGGSHTVTINGNGVDAQLGLFGHASMGDAEIYAINILDEDNDMVVGTVNGHGYSTIGTVSAHSMNTEAFEARTVDAQSITAVGTVTAGPVISSSINTGDITSVGTVSAARINGTTLQAGSVSLVNNNTQYATIGTAGLSIGTVTTQSATTRALAVVNGVGATVASITQNGNIHSSTAVSAPSMFNSYMETSDLRFFDESRPQAYRTASRVPFNMDTAYITDSGEEYFQQDGPEDTWTFLSVETHVPYSEFPYITVSSDEDEGIEAGQYWFTVEDGVIDESSIPSGVFNRSHSPAANRMYINIDNGSITVFGLSL